MVKLFCFTCAGGTAALYNNIKNEVSENIEMICFEYPGHGNRSREDLKRKFDDLLEEAAEFINSNISDGEDFAVMGYSMGSLIAYEAVAGGHLKKNPMHLFFAAHAMPGDVFYKSDFSKLSDEEFAEEVKELGGFEKYEKRMLNNRYFRKKIFDPLRADYDIHEQYEKRDHDKLDIPVDIFYSRNDILEERIVLWKDLFSCDIDFHEMGDNHFFINDCHKEMAEIISEALSDK